MGNKINAKLGLSTPTRPRARVKGAGKDAKAAALTSATCPRCRGAWVIEHVVHGQPLRGCGHCGHTWVPEQQVTL